MDEETKEILREIKAELRDISWTLTLLIFPALMAIWLQGCFVGTR